MVTTSTSATSNAPSPSTERTAARTDALSATRLRNAIQGVRYLNQELIDKAFAKPV